MNNLEKMYKDTIISHNKAPRNFKELSCHNHEAHGKNSICGDEYFIYANIRNDIVEDISFQGVGCAISKASASIMTDFVKGKSIEEIEAVKQQFIDLLTEDEKADLKRELPRKLNIFASVKAFPVRVKCATLAWRTLEAILAESHKQKNLAALDSSHN